jgi:hypothetical protein
MADPVQPQFSGTDADQLSRFLDLELIQKRASWKQTVQRRRALRSFAFLFLFLLVLGCLAGFFFVFTRVSEQRPNPPASATVRP